MLYYADRISENIRRREPEGYLICVNVPIARSGTQQYLQDELGQSGDDMKTVYRPEEEVFSPATMASFEGMPVTNDHPDTEDGVTAENIQWLQKGHAQNVRRGTGAERNMLIADLVITDPDTIQEVLDGKREISCGYNYELCEEDGKLVQRQIRGNHIAIVDKGRAGKRVSIKDSAPKIERRKVKMDNKKHVGIMTKMFAAFARDAEPDDLEAAVDAIEDITAEEPVNVPAEQTEDEGPDKMDLILEKLDQLIQAMAAKGADEEPEEADPIEKLEDDLDEIEKSVEVKEGEDEDEEIDLMEAEEDEDPDDPASKFVDPEVINEQDEDEAEELEEEETVISDSKRACDAARIAIKSLKPVIASLPPSQRKAAADKAVAQIRKNVGLDAKPKKNGYTALKQRKRAADRKADPAEIGRRIMAARNVNYKK